MVRIVWHWSVFVAKGGLRESRGAAQRTQRTSACSRQSVPPSEVLVAARWRKKKLVNSYGSKTRVTESMSVKDTQLDRCQHRAVALMAAGSGVAASWPLLRQQPASCPTITHLPIDGAAAVCIDPHEELGHLRFGEVGAQVGPQLLVKLTGVQLAAAVRVRLLKYPLHLYQVLQVDVVLNHGCCPDVV